MNKRLKKKKLLLAISTFFLVFIAGAVGAYYYYVYLPYSIEYTASPVDCKTLSVSDNGGINLVLFATKDKVEEYTNYLFSTSPFDKEKDKFNIYYIDNFIPKCSIYKSVAILCYSKELLRKAAACQNDFIIVLKEDSSDMRSSSYLNVMSLNLEHPLSVFQHEFGHSFANLAEEYVPATIPRGSENCQASCASFTDSDGCFKECSDGEHYRSINFGVMRTLSSSDFGKFNEKLILKSLAEKYNHPFSSQITGNQILETKDCSEQFYYEAVYDKTTGEIGKTKQYGCAGNLGSVVTDNLIFTDAPGGVGMPIIGGTFTDEDISRVVQIPAYKVDDTVDKKIGITVITEKDVPITLEEIVDFSGVQATQVERKTGIAMVAQKVNEAIASISSGSSRTSITDSPLVDEGDIIISMAINETNSTDTNSTNASAFNQRFVTQTSSQSSPTLTINVIREIGYSDGKFFAVVLLVLAIVVAVCLKRKFS